MQFIKKIFTAIIKAPKAIAAWIKYQEFKPAPEIVGLFIALCCAAVLFFLPSYDPPYTMTSEKFTSVCEKNGFKMTDVTDSYFYSNAVVEDTLDDYTLKYFSCTKGCFAKFFYVNEVQYQRELGGFETTVYNSKFQLTTFIANDRTATVYRNGTELLVVSGPKTDADTLKKILKKCRIPAV